MNGATKIGSTSVDIIDCQTPSQHSPPGQPHTTPSHPCQSCGLNEHCLPALFSGQPASLRDYVLSNLIRHQEIHVLRREYLFRQDDVFNSVFIVQSGAVKTVLLDAGGCEQITGFFFPGDVFGLDGINTHHYTTSCLALGNARVCAIEFAQLEKLSSSVPSLQHHVFRMMAREIERNQRTMAILNHKSAEQRVAYLLLRYALHRRRLQLPTLDFSLPMSRRDMANHLGLAMETVSRILSRFQRLALCRIHGRRIVSLNIAALQEHFEHTPQPFMQ
ncbi:MAG: Crp/Fnr family transcriptional regulator [Alcanivorax sp.]|nr:MAG: Crp/Fnr family transcriptional regulator [Alcanivorax sp.]